MAIYSRDHYESEVKSLEEGVQRCRSGILAAEQRVSDLKVELSKKETAVKSAIFLRDFHFPQQRPDVVIGDSFVEVKSTRRKGHKMQDYVPHVVTHLQREGSTHYKAIVSHLSEAMKENLGDHQVYKALRRIIDLRLAPLQMDPKHKGYFMLISGNSDAHSVGANSGSYNKKIASPDQGLAMDA